MLNKTTTIRQASSSPRHAQEGVVLLVALIILIAMTLAGIALIRSTDIANIIAGNLAFKQAATHYGDRGVEAARTWLNDNKDSALLNGDVANAGYSANGNDPNRSPAAGQTWEAYWATLAANRIATVPADGLGYTASYIIDRMCTNAGARADGAACSESTVPPPDPKDCGNSLSLSGEATTCPPAIYYRITVRIAGPRNTVSFIQAMTAM